LNQATESVSSVSPGGQARPQSVLRGFMSEVSSINTRIAELTKQLGPETLLSVDQKTAINTELSALQTQYTQVVTSDVFKQIADITAQVTQVLSLGGSSSGLVSSLGQYRNLLGDDFLGLVQFGDLAKLGNISSGLGTIVNAEIDSVLTKQGTTAEVANAIKLVTDALNGGRVKSDITEYVAPALVTIGSSRPTPLETVFYGAGDLAIALRSYSPEDMLKMAAAHADLDPVSVLMLVAPPKDDQSY